VLLAFDTSTPATVVAVATSDGTLLAEGRHDPAEGERPGHTTQLLARAETALAQAGAGWPDVARLGVGIGPGGFTGLRVGLATGRALAAALGAETVPLLSLDVLASGEMGTALISVIDARRAEVFVRAYDGNGQPEGEARVTEPAALDGAGRLAVGDGAVRYRRILGELGLVVPGDEDPRHLIQGAALALMTASARPAPLLPAYLREPDAQPRQG